MNPEIKLQIELVPSTAFYSNLRSILDKADWDILRKLVYKNANYKCEICGGKGDKHPVECHEVFEYIDLNNDFEIDESQFPLSSGSSYSSSVRIQKLLFCQSLCPNCHEAKHFGLAQIKGNGERAKETLKRVNGWNDKQVEDYIRASFSQWHQRSRYQWKIDIDMITQYGISLDKYKEKIK